MSQSEYWDNFRRERISRRRMLKGGLLAGAGLLTASAIGCGESVQPGPSSSTTPAATTPVSGASPAPAVKKPTGTFTSSAGAPKGEYMDPHRMQHSLGTWIQWSDDLIMADENGTTDQGLAKSWTVAPDGLSWTFNLQKGVLFHDETEFTAEDVKFSFERQMKMVKSSAQPIWAGFYDHTEIIDPYTVKMVLKQPQMALPVHLQTIARIVPKKYIEKVGDDYFMEHVVGTGPWKVMKWESGTRTEYEAWEKHYARVPKFQKHIAISVPDASTALAMLQTGELDVTGASLPTVDQVKAIPGVQLLVKDNTGWTNQGTFAFTDDGPGKVWKDVRVRKAFQYAMDRETVAKTWGKGVAKPATLMVYPYTFGYNPNLKPWPYDLQKAKQLMAEAGYPNGIDISIYIEIPTEKESIDALAIVMNKDGLFRVKQVILIDGIAWLQMLQGKKITITDHAYVVSGMIGSLYAYAGDVGFLADTYWGRKAMYSYPHPDDEFEDMIIKQRSITDVEKRKKFLQDMLQLKYDRALFPMFLYTPYFAALGPRIKPNWKTFGGLNPWYWNIEPK